MRGGCAFSDKTHVFNVYSAASSVWSVVPMSLNLLLCIVLIYRCAPDPNLQHI